MIKRFCDTCGVEVTAPLSENVIELPGDGISVRLTMSCKRDYCPDCAVRAAVAILESRLAGKPREEPPRVEEPKAEEPKADAPKAEEPPKVDAPKPEKKPKPEEPPKAEKKPKAACAVRFERPDAPEGSRWLTVGEIVGDDRARLETVRARLMGMRCPSVKTGDKPKSPILYCVTEEQIAKAMSNSIHNGLDTVATELPEGWHTISELADMSAATRNAVAARLKAMNVESRLFGRVQAFRPTEKQLAALALPGSRGNPARRNAEKLRAGLVTKDDCRKAMPENERRKAREKSWSDCAIMEDYEIKAACEKAAQKNVENGK